MTDAEDKAWKDYSNRFRRKVLPKLLDSAVFMSVASRSEGWDVRQATEIGAALLMGKPVLLVCPVGTTLPEGLRRAADVIVEDYDGGEPESQKRLLAAIEKLGVGK